MVYINIDSESKVMGLEEYVDFVKSRIDVYDFDSLTDTSWSLAALANDRDFLLERYHHELKVRLDGHSAESFSAQSLRLHASDNFYIRANIWPSVSSANHNEERTLFSYEVPHNHNFHFCSVGYFGPGYETDLYRCEAPETITGYSRERIKLDRCPSHRLEPGSILAYEAFKDVHIQKVPESTSISLNLMCRNPKLHNTQQFLFDIENECVAGSVGTIVGNRLFLINMCRFVNNDNTVDLLSNIVTDHACKKTRALALSVLKEVRSVEFDRLTRVSDAEIIALSDRPIVYGDDMIRVGNTLNA